MRPESARMFTGVLLTFLHGGCWLPGCESQDLRSKGSGMARAHLQEQWKKVGPPTNNTALTLTDLQTD